MVYLYLSIGQIKNYYPETYALFLFKALRIAFLANLFLNFIAIVFANIYMILIDMIFKTDLI